MSKKKKTKIKTLTEEEYNQYLMSLKDEEPAKVVDEQGALTPQK